MKAAEDLIKERGAVKVVASALAYIAGAKEIVSRSLLSAQQVKGGYNIAHVYVVEGGGDLLCGPW